MEMLVILLLLLFNKETHVWHHWIQEVLEQHPFEDDVKDDSCVSEFDNKSRQTETGFLDCSGSERKTTSVVKYIYSRTYVQLHFIGIISIDLTITTKADWWESLAELQRVWYIYLFQNVSVGDLKMLTQQIDLVNGGGHFA